MNPVSFKIDAGFMGHGSIVVNGEDVSDKVRAFTLTAKAGEPTLLILELLSTGTVEGEGIIQAVQQRIPASSFLSAIDRAKVESMVMDRLEWGDDNIIQATINCLEEIVNAAES